MFQEEQLCYKPQGQKCASKELQLGGFDVSQNILKIVTPPPLSPLDQGSIFQSMSHTKTSCFLFTPLVGILMTTNQDEKHVVWLLKIVLCNI